MNTPADDTKLEKLVLLSVIRGLDKQPPKFIKSSREGWLYAAQGMLIAFSLDWVTSKYLPAAWLKVLAPIFIFAMGTFLAAIVFWAFLSSLWFFLKPFINRPALEARLRELQSINNGG